MTFYTLKLCFIIRISLPVQWKQENTCGTSSKSGRGQQGQPPGVHISPSWWDLLLCSVSSAFHKAFVRSLDNQAAQCLWRQSHTLLHKTKSGKESSESAQVNKYYSVNSFLWKPASFRTPGKIKIKSSWLERGCELFNWNVNTILYILFFLSQSIYNITFAVYSLFNVKFSGINWIN